MPSNIARVAATSLIWGAFTAMILWGKSPTLSGTDTVIITAIVAAISTGVVWRGPGDHSEAETIRSSEKLKRSGRSRAARLADSMDDDEAAALLDALSSRLAARHDGDAVPLESLAQEQEQKARRR